MWASIFAGALLLGAALGCGSEDTSSGSGGAGPASGNGGSGASASTSTGGMSAGGAGGSGGSGGADPCGAIGSPCSGACPDGLACYSGTQESFCIPAAAECGGFAGAECPAGQPVCMTLSGADYGPCGTEPVKQCVCANAPGALADC